MGEHYMVLSDAHAAVVRDNKRLDQLAALGDKVLDTSVPLPAGCSLPEMLRTPIFDRVFGRRGEWEDRYHRDFSTWSRPCLIEYITRWSDTRASRLKKASKVTLGKIAEDVRDWRGMSSEYPDDSDLIICVGGGVNPHRPGCGHRNN